MPDGSLSIDESMIRFNGRHKDIVYMPLKPIKYGFKVFILADSTTGYAFCYELYSSNHHSSEEDEESGYGYIVDLNIRLTAHL